MRLWFRGCVFFTLMACVTGCGRSPSQQQAGGNQPVTNPALSGLATAAPLPQPFQGRWNFNQARTLDENKKVMSPQHFGMYQRSVQAARAAGLGEIHPDIDVRQASFIGFGHPMAMQYDLTSWTQSGSWLDAQAWLHEDVHDPGDMAKIDMRFKIDNGELWIDSGTAQQPSYLIFDRLTQAE
ncbi:MAG: hypothetical protein AAGB29_02570 [Planctomycetota bacterium]